MVDFKKREIILLILCFISNLGNILICQLSKPNSRHSQCETIVLQNSGYIVVKCSNIMVLYTPDKDGLLLTKTLNFNYYKGGIGAIKRFLSGCGQVTRFPEEIGDLDVSSNCAAVCAIPHLAEFCLNNRSQIEYAKIANNNNNSTFILIGEDIQQINNAFFYYD